MADTELGRGGGEGYDVIGDIHGHADMLEGLLRDMGYVEVDGVYKHSNRKAVFVGDLIDRGPAQVRVVRLVQAMLAAGNAHIVAGNHEYNAVAWHTADPENPGQSLRPNVPRTFHQHKDFLDQVGAGSSLHAELVDWFTTLPLWLELDGIRVVHACWDPKSIEVLASRFGLHATCNRELVAAAVRVGSPENQAVEGLQKGPQITVSDRPYLSVEGYQQDQFRYKWWDISATTLRAAALTRPAIRSLDGGPYPELPNTPIVPPVQDYIESIPVFYGHYWRSGLPQVSGPHTACVDYSVAGSGPLVAYRWSGESLLANDNFVQHGPAPLVSGSSVA